MIDVGTDNDKVIITLSKENAAEFRNNLAYLVNIARMGGTAFDKPLPSVVPNKPFPRR